MIRELEAMTLDQLELHYQLEQAHGQITKEAQEKALDEYKRKHPELFK